MKLSKKDLKDELIESCVKVTFDWDEIEESAPEYGGVYIMIDEDDHVVYVMKTGRLGSFKEQLLEHWEQRMWLDLYFFRKYSDEDQEAYYSSS